ncbi:MAG: phosphotransferase [Alphaproteobacteria bacterium]|nr:phosphotransferase [Alphaproteobacteria bacterium]MBV9967540.1 phosphotransferase [Alphaproteobacteria bacterium]
MTQTALDTQNFGEEAIAAALTRMGQLKAGERPRCQPLPGGVSSDIWLVDVPGRRLCVKRALPRLKVEQIWEAPIRRNFYEWNWFKVAGRVCPDAVPPLVGQDASAGLFVMEYLDPSLFPVWKDQLRDGNADPTVAEAVATRLVQIHNTTAGDHQIARLFGSDDDFTAIRLEPYLLATAQRHPDLAAPLKWLMQETLGMKLALVHGDVSPKNILIGRRGPVFLDAECAWYGDPAFDLAFCLNHLLLKCMLNRRAITRFLGCYDRFAETYLRGVNWELREELEPRAAQLLPALMLARVDGKSPVEYITEDRDKERVRKVARILLTDRAERLDTVRDAWAAEL